MELGKRIHIASYLNLEQVCSHIDRSMTWTKLIVYVLICFFFIKTAQNFCFENDSLLLDPSAQS